jgi:hypothetical protein
MIKTNKTLGLSDTCGLGIRWVIQVDRYVLRFKSFVKASFAVILTRGISRRMYCKDIECESGSRLASSNGVK